MEPENLAIPITPRRDLFNQWNERILEGGRTYYIEKYLTPDLVVVRINLEKTKAIPRSWLVECGALEPTPKPQATED